MTAALDARSTAGTIMHFTPASTARAITSSRSASNCWRSRWQWVSISGAGGFGTARSGLDSGEFQTVLNDLIDPFGVRGFAVDTNERLRPREAYQQPAAIFHAEFVSIQRVD